LPGLELHPAATRVQALLRERARLVREAQKKKQQLEQLEQRISRDAQDMAANMAPLLERHRLLVGELTALLEELLAPGRLSKRARSQVAQIRRSLEFQGVLSPIDDWATDAADDHPAGASRATTSEVAGARQVGQEKRSLRDIFRNLARAVHPDKARHDAERAQRNEVMKQVTRAYEDGDLARLVQLESAWNDQLAATASEDPDVRCRHLERVNRELLDQIRHLTREIRDVKRHAQQAFQGASPTEIVTGATQELDELDAIGQLLRQFRDGRITLRPSPAQRGRPRGRSRK